jgi:hypothetical protein
VILKSTTDERVSWEVDSTSSKPFTLLEQLEPRILLSGDGLLNIAPDPLDSLLDNMPQIVQYAEVLDTSEQAEEQAPSDTHNSDIYPPIFTLSADDESVETAESPAGLDEALGQEVSALTGQIEAGHSEQNSAVVIETTVDEFENNETVITTEDENLPVNIDENISTEEATSIEIRGPPANELEDDLSNANLEDVALQTQNSVLDEYAAEMQPDGTVELPGLYLVDPTVDYFDGQIVYLDFGGVENVTYDGPVVVEGIDIPEFSAEAVGLSGQEQEIISQILTTLKFTFEGSGVIFTLTEPEAGIEYSTIYIGGDDSAFAGFGSFIGLAEKVDAGNLDLSDNALVFSENIVSADSDSNSIAAGIAGLIAHEVGHLLGYRHLETDDAGLLDSLAVVSNGVTATLVGEDQPNTWTIIGPNIVNLNGITYYGAKNLVGGGGDDVFVFSLGASVEGNIDGGGGHNTLDYSAFRISPYDPGIVLNLENGAATGVAGISNIQTIIGSAGEDWLLGSASDTTWNVTANNAGNVGGLTFTNVENLIGAAQNEDTFVFEQGGAIDGIINGGIDGFDTLVINGGSFDSVVYTATGPTSGTIERDGDVITYAGLEPIADNMSATDRVITTGDLDDQARLTDNGVNLTLESTSAIPTFESITFAQPTNSLTINLGDDLGIPILSKDVLTINSFDAAGVNLTVNGEDGKDEVNIVGVISAGDVTINAETITVSSTVTATGNVTLNTEKSDDGSIGIDGIIVSLPSVEIDLTGATLNVIGDVQLVATATAEIDSTTFTLGPVTGATINVFPDASILLSGTTITAASLSAEAKSVVNIMGKDEAAIPIAKQTRR